ncbi:hypothetical protein F0L74_16550 [Chitinophaga agrisoli]|uniref:Uncharacterized protein n=1 Tax=Chitinophaga agrisoli TaxID=2607653 RepID=A0A5B2VR37_9BACT|nr:hypothetical protein [Chitinophaga agrisoli]KAA2241505.1 hypothetical protein F0L74_16550 [Chitinophaga agrisoli]
MKSNKLFKITLLVIPTMLLIYIFLTRDKIDPGSGVESGSYDVSQMYILVSTGLYLLMLSLIFLLRDTRGNVLFLLIAILLLVITATMAVHVF